MSDYDGISRIHLFAPPYDRVSDQAIPAGISTALLRGCAAIWWLEDAARQEREFEWLRDRPHGLPLIVLLPPPHRITATLPVLNFVPSLRPRAVLPGVALGTPDRLRQVLGSPPRSIPEAAGRYLRERGLLRDRRIRREIYRILELEPDVTSVTRVRRERARHFRPRTED